PVVEPGDLIVVLEARVERALVTVVGEVAQPGTYDLAPGMTLLEALTRAGGATPKADLKRVGLARAGEQIQSIDVDALLKGARQGPSIPLQPGDTLLVRENPDRVLVIGEVARQGEIALNGPESVLELLVRAGGASGSADLSKATILRRGPDGRSQSIPVDLKRLATKGHAIAPEMKGGDLLFVPSRSQKARTNWTQYLSPISLLFGLFGGA
ncbi:MAG TPA: SLBB domain-containing protein, partial [Armatimonadota bacterium]|nr:SLBB domain-containing protein [Armatimonadota bacterium]